ncbi:MAG: hypothetical protein K9G30_06070 [Parvibaculum sp.]|nr:hypothetical protein [Parvibaculum sp.]
MKTRLLVLTALYAFLSIGAVSAAEQTEGNQASDTGITPATAPVAAQNPAIGFGSGSGMGSGGGFGSASSPAGGFGSPVSGSGSGSQTFGGGFNQQQTAGSGPLSTGGAGAAGGPP